MTYIAAIVTTFELPEALNMTEAQIYARNLRDKILQESEHPIITCDIDDIFELEEDEYDL